MAQLTVRGVPDEVAAALKVRAARAGRSAEAEHRRILEKALLSRGGADFFEAARAWRVRMPPGTPGTTELLRRDRDRNETQEA